ncbi:hypothetical protein GW17_00046175 [Ensete ventricosum]|nr:hypothetical protein GW17_00046175 [Ensete ventricosum]
MPFGAMLLPDEGWSRFHNAFIYALLVDSSHASSAFPATLSAKTNKQLRTLSLHREEEMVFQQQPCQITDMPAAMFANLVHLRILHLGKMRRSDHSENQDLVLTTRSTLYAWFTVDLVSTTRTELVSTVDEQILPTVVGADTDYGAFYMYDDADLWRAEWMKMQKVVVRNERGSAGSRPVRRSRPWLPPAPTGGR